MSGIASTPLGLSVQLSPLWYAALRIAAALVSPTSRLPRLWETPGVLWHLEALKAASWGAHSLACSFPFSRGAASCADYCSMPENCSINFVCCYLRWDGKFSYCYTIIVISKHPITVLGYIFIGQLRTSDRP